MCYNGIPLLLAWSLRSPLLEHIAAMSAPRFAIRQAVVTDEEQDMQQNLKRVRNVRVNSRTSADLGWQVQDEFERTRLEKPFVPVQVAASNEDAMPRAHREPKLDPLQQYLVARMANRQQVQELAEQHE